MIETAFVKIWGRRIGAVAWDPTRDYATFEYTQEAVEQGVELAPVRMPLRPQFIYSFPEHSTRETFKGLPGLLADALPDRYGNQLINAWLLRNGRPENSLNPVEMLCFIGSRGMGALEFEPAQFRPLEPSKNIELEGMVDVAKLLLSKKTERKGKFFSEEDESIQDILKIGTSAGGARPKAIIAYNESSAEVRSGQSPKVPPGFQHWLIKLDGVSDAQFGRSSGYGRVEMAYYYMAKDAGIDMMDCKLIEENGRAHFMTRRFDRDGQTKHHVQTFCALMHADFNDMGAYNYESLFRLMRSLKLPYKQMEQQYVRMVFNVLSKNCDDHTKNFAFMLKEGGKWEITPAYDICFAYRSDSHWVSKHALSVNGKREGFALEDLLAVAKSASIKKPDRLISRVASSIQNWQRYAGRCGVSKELTQHIKNHFPKIK